MELESLLALDPTAVSLHAGDLSAVFLPAQGMLGASLAWEGKELLGRVDDIGEYAQSGRTCGIPLLYPWANRLGRVEYTAGGRTVSLAAVLDRIGHDENGLPMHGVPWTRLKWRVLEWKGGSLRARLDWTAKELLQVFPFPHRVELKLTLTPTGLRIETLVSAEHDNTVPISFGFHPYFRIPGVARTNWRLGTPAMRLLKLDGSHLPTGDSSAMPAQDVPLGEQDLDDGYALVEPTAKFVVEGGDAGITVEFESGYTHAQLFAPHTHDYLAIEPMTAPSNALVSGQGLRVVEPGTSFSAIFRIGIDKVT